MEILLCLFYVCQFEHVGKAAIFEQSIQYLTSFSIEDAQTDLCRAGIHSDLLHKLIYLS